MTERDLIGQLRGHRRRLGLSQQNVADRMGHGARSIVSDLENGQRAPVLSTLLAWTNALGLRLTLSLNGSEVGLCCAMHNGRCEPPSEDERRHPPAGLG